jgi:hypothetical protein
MDRAGVQGRAARATLRRWKRPRSACFAGCAGSSSSRRRSASIWRPRSSTTTLPRRGDSWRACRSATRSAATSSNCSRRGNVHSRAGPVAQLVEQGTFNPKVAGSIPARPIRLRCSACFCRRGSRHRPRRRGPWSGRPGRRTHRSYSPSRFCRTTTVSHVTIDRNTTLAGGQDDPLREKPKGASTHELKRTARSAKVERSCVGRL